MQQVVETRHRIAIIGGGIAGLSLALALSNLNKTQLKQWDIVVFESKPHYSDHDHYLCIWKFGIKALLELGIGKRLGSIAFPISSLCSVDCLANQTVVDWTHAPDENLNSDNLPPMVGLRKVDLIRTLLTGLTQRADLIRDSDLVFSRPNNLNSINSDITADLAAADWFHSQDFSGKLPQVYFGWEFESYQISSSSGLVKLSFSNGEEVDCDVLVGADGYHSKVRELLNNGRCPPQHSGSCVFQGCIDLTSVPNTEPLVTDFGTTVNSLAVYELLEMCSETQSRSFISGQASFAFTFVGHGRIGWTLVCKQSKPREHETEFLQRVANNQISIISSAEQHMELSLLNQRQILDLALFLLSKDKRLPYKLSRAIAGSEMGSLSIRDNVDLVEEPPLYTSPYFHPGRVILIGDAAHTNSINVHGSQGASLAVADAITLAKLLGHVFSPNQIYEHIRSNTALRDPIDIEYVLFEYIGSKFLELREQINQKHMVDARAISKWTPLESTVWKYAASFFEPQSWMQGTFDEMQNFGGVALDHDGYPKVNGL